MLINVQKLLSKYSVFLICVSYFIISPAYENIVTGYLLGGLDSGSFLIRYHNLLISLFIVAVLVLSELLARKNIWVLTVVSVLPCWMALSALWSNSLVSSLQASFGMWVLVLLGALTVLSLERFKVVKCLYLIVFFWIATSLLFVFLGPETAIHEGTHEGLWIGGYTHKNQFGFEAVLLLLLSFWFVWLGDRKFKLIGILSTVISIIVLFGTSSATAIVLGVLSLVFLGLLYLLVRYKEYKLTVLLFLILLAVVIFFSQDFIFELLGRSSTFTGRVSIWLAGISAMDGHWFVGRGFNDFYTITDYPILARLGPHNGYLATLLYGGVVALTLFSCVLMWTLYRIYHSAVTSGLSELGFLFGVVFCLFLLANVTETYFWARSGYWWPLFVASVAYFSSLVPTPETGKDS